MTSVGTDINAFDLLVAGSGEESPDVCRTGRGGGPEGEDCGADGANQPPGSREQPVALPCHPGDAVAT